MVVVVVVGILATMAVPSYRNAVERTVGYESEAALNIIFRAEQQYFLASNPKSYGTLNQLQGIPSGTVYLPPGALTSNNWENYRTENVTATTFRAVADRRGTTPVATRTIDQTGTLNPLRWPP